jgi:hypothetical protein
LFYKGFVELFGWQHRGNGWQHVAGFRLSVPQKLYKISHLKGKDEGEMLIRRRFAMARQELKPVPKSPDQSCSKNGKIDM